MKASLQAMMWNKHIFALPDQDLSLQLNATLLTMQPEFFKKPIWGEFKVRQYRREKCFLALLSNDIIFF